jgi:hypothetical protein
MWKLPGLSFQFPSICITFQHKWKSTGNNYHTSWRQPCSTHYDRLNLSFFKLTAQETQQLMPEKYEMQETNN